MRFASLIIASLASLVVAQTTTTAATSVPTSGGSACAAANIVDACVAQLKPRVEACPPNDYDCYCTTNTDLLTCYNNCPNDQNRFSVQTSVTQWCSLAKQYNTKTTVSVATVNANTATATDATNTTPTATVASAPTHTSNSASSIEVAGGLLALLFAGFGLLA